MRKACWRGAVTLNANPPNGFLSLLGLARAGAAAALFVVLCWPAAADEAPANIERVRDALIAPVWVNGVGPYPFLVDVASARSAMAPRVRQYVELEVAPLHSDTEGERSLLETEPASVLVQGMEPTECQFLVEPVDGFETKLGTRVAGVLGRDALPNPLYLDVQGRVLSSGRPSSTEQGESDEEPISLSVRQADDGTLTVSGVIDGERAVRVAVDTLYGGILGLPYDQAQNLGLLEDQEQSHLAIEQLQAEGFMIRLNRFHVAAAEIRRPICHVSHALEDAVAGLDFLANFEVILDVEEETLDLIPHEPGPVERGPLRGSGLMLGYLKQGRWVLYVATESPAAEAGAMTGDVLLAIDGEPVEGQRHGEIEQRLMIPAGEELTVTVERNGTRHEFTLESKELL